MNSFGLGLALDFRDNASSGMRTASQNFQNLSAAADTMTNKLNNSAQSVESLAMTSLSAFYMGGRLMQMGKSLIGTIVGLGKAIVSTGSDFESTRLTMNTLFGGVKQGEKALMDIVTFAAKTPFEINNLKAAAVMFKAIGVNIMDSVTSSKGSRQELVSWIGDLAAIRPELGIDNAVRAINRLVGTGQTRILKLTYGLDVPNLIGRKLSDTVAGREKDFADMIEALNAKGIMKKLEGTWSQMLSNMDDQWTRFKLAISDSGVFESIKGMFSKLYTTITMISSDEMTAIGKALGGVFVTLLKPLGKVVDSLAKFVNWLKEIVVEHPRIAQFTLTLIGVSGALLIIGGAVLFIGGALGLLATGVQKLAPMFTGLFTGVGGWLSKAPTLLLRLTPFIAFGYIMYRAWKDNLFGIRDLANEVFGQLIDIVELLSDAWNDNILGVDKYYKAQKLGILPFISAMLDLKYYAGLFFDGFKKGFESVFTSLNKFKSILDPYKVSLYSISEKIGGFIEKVLGFKPGTGWTELGKMVGKIVGALTIALPILKIVKIAFGAITSPIGLVIAAIAGLYYLWSNNVFGLKDKTKKLVEWLSTIDWKGIVGKVEDAIMKVWRVLVFFDWKGTLNDILTTFRNVWSGVISIAQQVWSYLSPIFESLKGLVESFIGLFTNSDFASKMDGMWSIMQPLFGNLKQIFESLMPVVQIVMDFIQTAITSFCDTLSTYVMPVVGMIIDGVADAIGTVMVWFAILSSAIKPIIQNIVGWAQTMWNGWLKDLVGQVIGFVGRVIYMFGSFYNWIYTSFIKPLVAVATFLFAVIAPVVSAIINVIIDAVGVVVNLIGGVVTAIMTILNGIIDFITGVFTGDWKLAWKGITEIFSGIWKGMKAVVKSVINAIILVINTFIGGLNLLKIPDWVPNIGGMGVNIPRIPYLSTGGEITKQGIDYLHPGEVVVNSPTTKELKSFLQDYAKTRNSVPAIESTTTNNTSNSIIRTISNPPARSDNGAPITNAGDQYDYSVKFEAGSIVFTVSKDTSEKDFDSMVEKLMKAIERKQQLRAMALRKKQPV